MKTNINAPAVWIGKLRAQNARPKQHDATLTKPTNRPRVASRSLTTLDTSPKITPKKGSSKNTKS